MIFVLLGELTLRCCTPHFRRLVDLPCENSRESILKKLLAKENVESVDFKELAIMTEGYTGIDLKV